MSRLVFLKSAVKPEHYPNADRPEIALIGRSNAGKSSFINAIGNRKLAKVSGQPGKTRLLNFFDWGENYRLVDMPGYGYSARSGNEQRSWQQMIENYLSLRGNLVGLILIMDIRRSWSKDEEGLKLWLQKINQPVVVILNKADKLSRNQKIKKMNEIKKASGVEAIFAVSCLKKDNIQEVEEFLFKNWVEPYLEG